MKEEGSCVTNRRDLQRFSIYAMTLQRVDPHAACGQTPKDTRTDNATVDAVSERSATEASVEGMVKNRTPKRLRR